MDTHLRLLYNDDRKIRTHSHGFSNAYRWRADRTGPGETRRRRASITLFDRVLIQQKTSLFERSVWEKSKGHERSGRLRWSGFAWRRIPISKKSWARAGRITARTRVSLGIRPVFSWNPS